MNEGKFYTREDGLKFVRVTHVQNLLNKPALIPWAVNCAVDFVDDHATIIDDWQELIKQARKAYKVEGEKAMDIGSQVHHMICDGTVRVDLPHNTEEVDTAYQSFLKWQRDFQAVPKKQEITVYKTRGCKYCNGRGAIGDDFGVDLHSCPYCNGTGEEPLYAGTLDWIGDLLVPKSSKKKQYVVDFKVSGHLYPEQHVMQLTAYEQAYKETFGKNIPNLGNVRLCKDKIDYEWREYSKEEKKAGWDGFKALLQLYNSIEEFKKIKRRKK
jgi:hypothetical protein